jgi:hypothetical protein
MQDSNEKWILPTVLPDSHVVIHFAFFDVFDACNNENLCLRGSICLTLLLFQLVSAISTPADVDLIWNFINYLEEFPVVCVLNVATIPRGGIATIAEKDTTETPLNKLLIARPVNVSTLTKLSVLQ